MMRVVMFVSISLFLLCTAHAHGVNLFATAEGDVIHGYAYFSDGKPVANTPVTVKTAAGDPLGEVETDGQGEFRYSPELHVDHYFSLELPDGHAASFTLPATELAGLAENPAKDTPLPAETTPLETLDDPESAGVEKRVEEAVSRQIAPLRKQIDAYQHAVRLHDVIGGIGYIAGLLALVFWLKSRSGKGTPS
ncbi:MAG: hypothetical protein AMXMBFR84_10370 [Candidatus Hydrogenedentota bacterium]